MHFYNKEGFCAMFINITRVKFVFLATNSPLTSFKFRLPTNSIISSINIFNGVCYSIFAPVKNLVILLSLFLLTATNLQAQTQKYALSGTVKDAKNGEDLIGVSISVTE